MVAGEPYLINDPELVEIRHQTRDAKRITSTSQVLVRRKKKHRLSKVFLSHRGENAYRERRKN
ncbi:maltose acetyltransferase domain-containing protein [Vibrio sp. M60_M31a]